jgi:succinate dehydrogenase / fumarate reductase cytochrome b subunit
MESGRRMPKAFFWRRMHSLTGFWFLLFLIEHLIVNSQAALYLGDDGSGFVRGVNGIRDLPYLPFIELFLLGFPIVIHLVWGIEYLRTSKMNSLPTDGTKPDLSEYPRNHAYSWQRITSWILLFCVIAHVVQMRFVDYPGTQKQGEHKLYTVKLTEDSGLTSIAERLNVRLEPSSTGNVLGIAPDFGTAELLMVRETFKMPIMIALYTIFVLAACYHGFNGLWTFLITWGVCLTERSQRIARRFANVLMFVVTIMGLSAIWLTYWINLKQ